MLTSSVSRGEPSQASLRLKHLGNMSHLPMLMWVTGGFDVESSLQGCEPSGPWTLPVVNAYELLCMLGTNDDYRDNRVTQPLGGVMLVRKLYWQNHPELTMTITTPDPGCPRTLRRMRTRGAEDTQRNLTHAPRNFQHRLCFSSGFESQITGYSCPDQTFSTQREFYLRPSFPSPNSIS